MSALDPATAEAASKPAAPHATNRSSSWFYQAAFWRMGLLAARLLPRPLALWKGRLLGSLYGFLHPRQRAIVTQNLLPVVDHHLPTAQQASRRLYREFGFKLADLWRYETGISLPESSFRLEGLEHLQAARQNGRGVLLVSAHLGNWELGGPLLAARGLPFAIISQPEPESALMELRKKTRARHGIETLVVGEGSFAFVEVVKRLQDGAVLGLLIDRPPASAAVTVELFGRPFLVSAGPAELARATGCAVLATYVVREGSGYASAILPEFDYDRAALENREARRQFAGRIMAAFKPIIRRHPEQWFNFTPLWTAAATAPCCQAGKTTV